jgi:hypothetical protein
MWTARLTPTDGDMSLASHVFTNGHTGHYLKSQADLSSLIVWCPDEAR